MTSSVWQVICSEMQPWLRIDEHSKVESITSNSGLHFSIGKYKKIEMYFKKSL